MVPAGGRCTMCPGLHWTCRPGIRRTYQASRTTTPRMGDQAVPAVRVRSFSPWGSNFMLRLQGPLPDGYTSANPEDLADRIQRAKDALGSRLLILGHHYQ